MNQQDKNYLDEKFEWMRKETKLIVENAIQQHTISCPVAKEVKVIKEEQQKYWLIKKYPGAIATIGVVYGLAIVLLFLAKIGVI